MGRCVCLCVCVGGGGDLCGASVVLLGCFLLLSLLLLFFADNKRSFTQSFHLWRLRYCQKLLEIGVDVDERDQVVIYFFVQFLKICSCISIYLSTLLLSIPFLPFLLLRVGEGWEEPSFMAISLCLTYFVDFVRKGHFTISGFNTLVLPYPSSELRLRLVDHLGFVFLWNI